jgi:hypothetical protein
MLKITTIARVRYGAYTKSMIGFAIASPAAAPRTKESAKIAILYAGLLTVMAVAQLFTFEKVIVFFDSLFVPPAGMLIPTLLVVGEVFALPFLLRMSLSVAFRWVSLGLSILVPVGWVSLSIWAANARIMTGTTGLFGTLDPLGYGAWTISFSLALLLLSLWSAWGLWPKPRRK